MLLYSLWLSDDEVCNIWGKTGWSEICHWFTGICPHCAFQLFVSANFGTWRNMIKHFPLRLILPESKMTWGQLMLLPLLVCWISLSLPVSVPWFRIACFSSCTWLWLGMSEWPWVIELNRLGRRRAGGGNAQPVIIWLLTPLINPLLRDQCPNYFIITPGAAALVNKHYALCHRWATNTGNDCRHHSVVDIKNLPPGIGEYHQMTQEPPPPPPTIKYTNSMKCTKITHCNSSHKLTHGRAL